MTAADLTPYDFLHALWTAGEWHSLNWQHPSQRGQQGTFLFETFDGVGPLLQRADELDGNDLWFGVCGMATKPAKRGGKSDVVSANTLFADLDFAGDGHSSGSLPTESEARTLLAGFALQPTVTVNTGNGLHLYWMLLDPVDARVGGELNDLLHATFKAQTGITLERRDLASILRLPGTMNHKTDPAKPVVIEDANGPMWTAKSVRQACTDLEPTGSTIVDMVEPTGSTHPLQGASWIDEVSARLDMHEVLARYGWAATGSRDDHGEHVAHPASTSGRSGSINANGRLYVYTPSTPLPVSLDNGDSTYDAIDVIALYDTGRNDPASRVAVARTEAQRLGIGPGSSMSTMVDIPAVPASWSDAHVGESFGSTLTGRWLYCRALGGWHRWDGRRWRLDPGEAVHEEFRLWIIALGEMLWKQAGAGDTMRQVARYRDKGKIDAAVTIARRLATVAATADEFDQHPHLLNVNNGVVDLNTGRLLAHDPALRLTKIAATDYRPDALHPDVDAVLGALDQDVVRWVQRLFGSAAYGTVVDDVLGVLDGTGSNGKTTLLTAAAAALGEYAAPASTRLLMARGVSDEHPTLLADLFGRRLVYIEETPEGGALKMEQVKAITGGGELKARFIGKDYFSFKPSHQIIVATNHRPAVNASDYAAWRRLRLVPFTRTYKPAHEAVPGDLVADRGLRGRLSRPAQREAMLAWIVAGAVAWHRDGLGACTVIDDATSAWRRDEDVIHAWWADCIQPGVAVKAGALYQSFVTWCEQEGRRYVSSNKEFVKKFVDHDLYRNHGVNKRNTSTGAWYEGITVVDVVGTTPGSPRAHSRELAVPPTTTTTTSDDTSGADLW